MPADVEDINGIPFASFATTLHADCTSVIKMFDNIYIFSASRAMYAGTGRDLLREGVKIHKAVHVSAHDDVKRRAADQSQRNTVFNCIADAAAK